MASGGRPSLSFNFAAMPALDPRITFTRASTGTFFDSAGVLTSAATNAPRFDYNPSTLAAQGLLIEEARTNLLPNSQDLAGWTKDANSVLTTDVEISPDGTLNADKFAVGTSTFPQITLSVTATTTNTHTLTCFVKNAGLNFIQLRIRNPAAQNNFFRAVFNLTTGAVTQGNASGNGTFTSASATSVGNGWWRCTITGIADTSGTSIQTVAILTYDANATVANSTNSAATDGLFIWGAQLEAGAFPTSYIPTTTTALTRAADVALVNTLSPWFNSASGTLYVEGQLATGVNPVTPPALVSLDDTTLSNRMQLRRQTPGTVGDFRFVSSGGNFTGTATAGTLTGINKQAAAYAVSDQSGVVNGTLMTGITPIATLPTITRLALGDGPGSVPLNGWLRRVTFYPRRLSNAELQTITS